MKSKEKQILERSAYLHELNFGRGQKVNDHWYPGQVFSQVFKVMVIQPCLQYVQIASHLSSFGPLVELSITPWNQKVTTWVNCFYLLLLGWDPWQRTVSGNNLICLHLQYFTEATEATASMPQVPLMLFEMFQLKYSLISWKCPLHRKTALRMLFSSVTLY